MIPSIEERREAAANLKSLTGVVPRGDNDAAGFIEALDYVLFDFGPNELGDIANRLADLIEPLPERTCRMERASWDDGQCTWGCRCSECGRRFEHETGRIWNYCPNCGARVVEP